MARSSIGTITLMRYFILSALSALVIIGTLSFWPTMIFFDEPVIQSDTLSPSPFRVTNGQKVVVVGPVVAQAEPHDHDHQHPQHHDQHTPHDESHEEKQDVWVKPQHEAEKQDHNDHDYDFDYDIHTAQQARKNETVDGDKYKKLLKEKWMGDASQHGADDEDTYPAGVGEAVVTTTDVQTPTESEPATTPDASPALPSTPQASANHVKPTMSDKQSPTPTPLLAKDETGSDSQAGAPDASTGVKPSHSRRVVPVVFSTGANLGFCDMLLSAAAYNTVVTVIGWGEPWRGFGTKITEMVAFLDTVEADDIVILHDGYDIHYQSSADEIGARFAQLNASVMYGAEKNCWPMNDDRCKLFPPSPLPRLAYGPNTTVDLWGVPQMAPRFLNAGALAGYVSALRPLIVDMAAEVNSRTAANQSADDQEIASMRFLSNKWGIQLDYWSDLFINVCYSQDDVRLVADPVVNHNSTNGTTTTTTSDRKVYFDIITDRIPGLVHYNGSAKWLGAVIRQLLWWSQSDAIDRDAIYFLTSKGERIKWIDHCRDITV